MQRVGTKMETTISYLSKKLRNLLKHNLKKKQKTIFSNITLQAQNYVSMNNNISQT